MASLNQLISEMAHALGQPNNAALRENIKLLLMQTRNEVIRRSYENHNYVEKHEYRLRYPLTKQGITDYIMRDDIVVINEYGEVQDKEEFLDMAFNWFPDGLDSSTSGSNNYWCFTKEQEPFKELGFTFSNDFQSDFISDGLRFSIFDDFS